MDCGDDRAPEAFPAVIGRISTNVCANDAPPQTTRSNTNWHLIQVRAWQSQPAMTLSFCMSIYLEKS
jgi:hypothetical protein